MANAFDTFASPYTASLGSAAPQYALPGLAPLAPLIGAAPDSSSNSSSDSSGSFLDRALGETFSNNLGSEFSAGQSTSQTVQSITSWLGPRGATIIVGLLLIVGGLWALANSGKVMAIVESHRT